MYKVVLLNHLFSKLHCLKIFELKQNKIVMCFKMAMFNLFYSLQFSFYDANNNSVLNDIVIILCKMSVTA